MSRRRLACGSTLAGSALLAGALLLAQGNPPPTPLVLLTRDNRQPVSTTIVNGQELIALDELSRLFQVTVREDTLTRAATVSYKGKSIIVSSDRAMASVGGRLIPLPSAPVRAGTRWLVPIELLNSALAPIYDSPIELRKSSRLLIVGNVRVPRVSALIEPTSGGTRLILDVTSPGAITVTPDAAPFSRVLIRVDADALDMGLPIAGAGLIEAIRAGDQPATLVVALRAGTAGTPRSSSATSDAGTRVTIDIPALTATVAPQPPSLPPAAGTLPILPPAPPLRALQTIVIDPGHGGDDAGVIGTGGATEKQLTLQIARRLKALIEAQLGIRVVLTREDDRAVTADERAATANNAKADLFLSLHFNASIQPAASGAEVYYLEVDEEAQEAVRAAQEESIPLPVFGGPTRPIDLIPWDKAQARHVPASAALGHVLEEVLRAHVLMSRRPLQKAPMRVLSGVNMPAVSIELAYLTNPAQSAKAIAPDFQGAVTQALYDGVVRFRDSLDATNQPRSSAP